MIRLLRILILQIFHGDFFNNIGHEQTKSDRRIESAKPQ